MRAIELSKFIIARYVFGNDQHIEIDEATVRRILTAKKCLIEAMCIEERFDMLLDNYLELEKDLVDPGILTRVSLGRRDFLDIKLLINRRLVNLLTTCRLYIDQIKSTLSNLSADFFVTKDELNKLFSDAYDTYLGYRVMEAVRNFSQHYELPVESVAFNMNRDGGHIILSVEISSSVEYYRRCQEFKKSILCEITDLGPNVDLKIMFREYVAGLSSVHMCIREILKESLSKYDNTVSDVAKQYKDKFCISTEADMVGLSIIECDDSGHCLSHEDILEDWTKRRQLFEKNNYFLQNLHNRFVTGRPEVGK